jgi:hypothetical protein
MAKKVMIEVFKAGKQTDSAGNTRDWKENDLDKMVKAFDELGEEVPWTIGHPKTDQAPAFAWCKKMVRKGKSLFADMSNITPELSGMLKKKMFKNRSIALRPNMSFRHIALLGAAPPAVKGLENFAWKEKDEFAAFDNCFEDSPEFTEDFQTNSALRTIARVFSNMRDRLIEKDGVEKADKVIDKFDIKNIERNAKTPPKDNEPLFKEDPKIEHSESNKGDEMEVKELEQKIVKMEATQKDFSEKITGLETENKTLKEGKEKAEKEFAEFKENKKKDELGSWFDEQVKEGRALPANKESTVATMMHLEGQESLDFAEGDKTVKKSPLDIFKGQIEHGQKVIEYAEFAKKGDAKSRDASGSEKEFSEKVKKLQTDEKLSFSEATAKVIAENPDLAKTVENVTYE